MQNLFKNQSVNLAASLPICLILYAMITQTGAARDLSADRPDSTESPITVDPGRFQIETSVISFTESDGDGTEFESFVLGETNVKFGLSNITDIQLVVTPYAHERSKAGSSVSEAEGIGDPIVRFKWNLWGNDDGNTAFGLLPHIKIPIGTEVSNDEWEGGIITPFAWDLTERFSLGFQLDLAGVFDESEGHIFQVGHTIVLGASITETLGVYIEYVGAASDIPYESSFSTGATFLLNQDFQWDVGLVVGLNDDSDDLSVFSGFTTRY